MKKGIITGVLFIMLAGLLTAGYADAGWKDLFKRTTKPAKTQAARPAPTPDLTGIEAPEIPYTPGPTRKHGDSPIWEQAINTFQNSYFKLNINHDYEDLILVGYYDLNQPDIIFINIALYNKFPTAPNEPDITYDVAFDAWIEFIKEDDGTFTRSLRSYVCSKIPTTRDAFLDTSNNDLVAHLNWKDGQERCRKITEQPNIEDKSKYKAYLAAGPFDESKNSANPQFDIHEFTKMIDLKVSFQFTQSGLQLVDIIIPYISPANLGSDPKLRSPAMYYVLFSQTRFSKIYNFIPDTVADVFIKPILKDGSNNTYDADFCYDTVCPEDHWHWTSIKTVPK